jgi:hypothetical protein
MKELPVASCITLEANEICSYKDVCDFNNGSETCHGSLERDGRFICNLEELRSMYNCTDSKTSQVT